MTDTPDPGSLRDQYDHLAGLIDAGSHAEARRDAGEFGEAVVDGFIEAVDGGHHLDQHTPESKPQGIDAMYLSDTDDRVHVAEDKTIAWGDYHAPYMSRTVDGRQNDDNWVADRSRDTQLDIEPDQVGHGDDQVGKEVFQVDLPSDTLARYSVEPDGSLESNAPDEIYALSDIIDAVDGWNGVDIDEASADTAQNDAEAGESADEQASG